MDNKLHELRCGKCGKLLGRVEGGAEIACPRCGALNKFNSGSNFIEFVDKSNRRRDTASGLTFS